MASTSPSGVASTSSTHCPLGRRKRCGRRCGSASMCWARVAATSWGPATPCWTMCPRPMSWPCMTRPTATAVTVRRPTSRGELMTRTVQEEFVATVRDRQPSRVLPGLVSAGPFLPILRGVPMLEYYRDPALLLECNLWLQDRYPDVKLIVGPWGDFG